MNRKAIWINSADTKYNQIEQDCTQGMLIQNDFAFGRNIQRTPIKQLGVRIF